MTSIGDRAFANCFRFSGNLVMGEAVKEIGNDAFRGCRGFVGPLTFGDSLTSIGNYAFKGCGQLSGNLVIPNSVTSIGAEAFCQCSGFTGGLSIPDSVTVILPGTFHGCSGFNGRLVIPNGVKEIGSEAFCGCGFTGDLILPDSLTNINSSAFYNCSGFSGGLAIPDMVNRIGDQAFCNCTGLSGNLAFPDAMTEIGRHAFRNCRGLIGDLTIPDAVTKIGQHAFDGCSGFTGELVMGKSLRSIQEAAFEDCSGLTSLTFNARNCAVADYIFCSLTNLKEITFGEEVDTILEYAFYGCGSVERIISKCEIPPIVGTNAFFGIPATIPIQIPRCTTSLYKAPEEWNRFDNYIEGPFKYQVFLESNFEEMGSVSIVQEPDCEVNAIVEAVPNEGCYFTVWMENDRIVSANPRYSFAVDRDRHLVAHFNTTGVDDNAAEGIQLYPNPANNVLTVSGENLKLVEVSNMMGQSLEAFSVEGPETRIDIGKLPVGIYLVGITDEYGKRCVRKLVKE